MNLSCELALAFAAREPYLLRFERAVGPWRSLVAHNLGVVGVAGSNPVGPTNFLL